jgi:hypothetical protein
MATLKTWELRACALHSYVASVLLVVCMPLVKILIALQYIRIFPYKSLHRIAIGLIAVEAITAITTAFGTIFM